MPSNRVIRLVKDPLQQSNGLIIWKIQDNSWLSKLSPLLMTKLPKLSNLNSKWSKNYQLITIWWIVWRSRFQVKRTSTLLWSIAIKEIFKSIYLITKMIFQSKKYGSLLSNSVMATRWCMKDQSFIGISNLKTFS